MAMVLTEEQIQLQDAAKKFLQDNSPVSSLRELRDNKDANGFSTDLWQEMVKLGWAGIIIDEEYGGLGLSPLWMGLIMEEAGRCLTASPLLSTGLLGASIIQDAGNADQKSAFLTAIAAGELLTALAVDETAHHNPTHIETTAEVSGDSFLLSGKKTTVLDGHVADKFIVSARTTEAVADSTDGITLFIVDAKAKGVTPVRREMVDSLNSCHVSFNNVRLGKADVLGEVGKGFPFLDKTLDIGRAAIAAELLGSCQETFERTIEYLKTRTQFDAVIGSFQALKHRAALMFCEIELSKSVVREALSALDESQDVVIRSRLVSLAKSQLNDTAKLVTNEGVQMFGGIGMTDEEEIGFFMKRARVAAHTFGTSSFHLNRYASAKGY